ncbi:hypothetical protein BDQ17DRAFT_1364969 [Cyathus striatus]|nr:hypothetical protein BDQ17DRAFT_1364969 [Cyathus striatus]
MGPGSCSHMPSGSPVPMDALSINTLYPLTEDEPASPPPFQYHEYPLQQYCWCHRIAKVVEKTHGLSQVFKLDVRKDGRFVRSEDWKIEDHRDPHTKRSKRPDETHVRAMFVDNLTGPVLQILGTKFEVEPFFFSYRENVTPGKGDHITITLTFLRSMPNPNTTTPPSPQTPEDAEEEEPEDIIIDTQAPLQLQSRNVILVPDLFSLHMVRAPTNEPGGSTLISYHHNNYQYNFANRLFTTGRSVYWRPNVCVLSLLWYPIYAWDEALEHLYSHLCTLEAKVMVTNDMQMTQELHLVRAHLLHYESLLVDFKKAVSFVLATPYPALDDPDQFNEEERGYSMELMRKESESLLREIARLEMSRDGMDRRLKNVMDLAFSSVNLEDSRSMQKLTKASVRDAAAMKQISYLSMVFLPATFVATIFGMNVDEINPGSNENLRNYFAVAVPLTALTVWIFVATQIQVKKPQQHHRHSREKKVKEEDLPSGKEDLYTSNEKNSSSQTLGWPVLLISAMFEKRKDRRKIMGWLNGGAAPKQSSLC